MKPRNMLLVILAVVAAIEILVAIAFDGFGLKGGLGKVMLGVALSAAVSAVPLYMVAVRPSARHLTALSLKAEVQDILIRIDKMAMEEGDPEPILRRAAEDVRRLLDVPRCTFWLFGSPDAVVEHRAPDLPPAATDFPFRESPESLSAVSRSGQCIEVEDVGKEPAYRKVAEEMERFGARSFLEAPLFLPEGPIGFLFLCRPEPQSWSDDSVRVAEAVARRVATAFAHARKFRSCEEQSAGLRSLLDHIPGLAYRGERDWTMSTVSAGVERMTGFSPREFLGGAVLWKDLIHPTDLLSVKAAFRSAVAKGEKFLRVEYRVRHRNGNYRWFADRRQIVYDDNGRFLYADGICLDITELKRAAGENAEQRTAAGVSAKT